MGKCSCIVVKSASVMYTVYVYFFRSHWCVRIVLILYMYVRIISASWQTVKDDSNIHCSMYIHDHVQEEALPSC